MRRLQIVLRDCFAHSATIPQGRADRPNNTELHTSASRMVHIQHIGDRPGRIRLNLCIIRLFRFNSYVKDGNE